jgi:hypothetical protein
VLIRRVSDEEEKKKDDCFLEAAPHESDFLAAFLSWLDRSLAGRRKQ